MGSGGAERDYSGSQRPIKLLIFPLGSRRIFFFLIKRRLARLNCMFKRLYGGGEGLGMDARG